jgi:hypothetical protein
MISGTVADMQDNPIPDASVTLLYTEQGRRTRNTVQSDSRGRFSAVVPAPQVDLITIEARGYARKEESGIPVPAENVFVALRRLASVSLRIVRSEADGSSPAPFTGEADIYLMQRRDPTTSPTSAVSEANVAIGQFATVGTEHVTVKEGQHALTGVEPGVYRVGVETALDYAESAPFKVEAHGSAEVVVIIGVRGVFQGLVRSQTTSEPVAAARITLACSSRSAIARRAVEYGTSSTADGRFAFDQVMPGTYVLGIQAEGYAAKTVEELQVSATRRPGTDNVYYLSKEMPSLTVTVLDAAGRPLPKVPLGLVTSRSHEPRSFFGETNEGGQYAFPRIPPNRYSLAATAPDNRARQKVSEVVLQEGEQKAVQVQFLHTVKVSGRATQNGAPYEGLLSFQRRGSIESAQFVKTDKAGALATELEVAEYIVQRSGRPGTAVTTIRDEQETTVEVGFEGD